MAKIVVFGGDSFVERSGITWPSHLVKDRRYIEGINVGRGAMGNKYIRMSTIWGVEKMIKKGYDYSDLLVMVSWSAPSRYCLYTDQSDIHLNSISVGINLQSIFTEKTSSDGFIYMPMSSSWDFKSNKIYYRELETENNSIIETLHDILYLQEYLKHRKIDYVMTSSWNIIDTPYETWTYDNNDCGNSSILHCKKLESPEYKWIRDLIDDSHFLPIKGEWEWVNGIFKDRDGLENSHHPLNHEHELFTKEMIIPFLDKKYGHK